MLTVSVMVGIGTIIIAKPLIQILYRSDYNQAAIVLILLGFAVIPSYLRYLFGNTLIAVNLQKKETVVAACRSGFNVCANLSLIPFYGYVGATVATVATDYLAIVIYAVILGKEGLIRRQQLRFIYKPLLAGILLSPIYFLFSGIYAFFSFVIFIILYIALLFIMRIFDPEEIEVFRKYIRNRGFLRSGKKVY